MKVYNNSNKEIIEIKLEHLSIMLNTHKELEIYDEKKHKIEELKEIEELKDLTKKEIKNKNKNKDL